MLLGGANTVLPNVNGDCFGQTLPVGRCSPPASPDTCKPARGDTLTPALPRKVEKSGSKSEWRVSSLSKSLWLLLFLGVQLRYRISGHSVDKDLLPKTTPMEMEKKHWHGSLGELARGGKADPDRPCPCH